MIKIAKGILIVALGILGIYGNGVYAAAYDNTVATPHRTRTNTIAQWLKPVAAAVVGFAGLGYFYNHAKKTIKQAQQKNLQTLPRINAIFPHSAWFGYPRSPFTAVIPTTAVGKPCSNTRPQGGSLSYYPPTTSVSFSSAASTMTQTTLPTDSSDAYVKQIKARQQAQLDILPRDSITKLYQLMAFSPHSTQLYIPKDHLTTPDALLRYLWAKRQPQIDLLNHSQREIFNCFMKCSENIEAGKEIPNMMLFTCEQLITLKTDATSILKAFLPQTLEEVIFIKKQFQKSRIERFFTHSELQRVISKNNLMNIHLPLTMLLIFDKKKQSYLNNQEALKIIDQLIEITVFPNRNFDSSTGISSFMITTRDQFARRPAASPLYNYEFQVWEMREPRSAIPMTRETLKQLQKLVQEAPFDVGTDNIFSREDGGAVIIDTENPGFPAQIMLPALEHYNQTGSPLPQIEVIPHY